MKIARCALLAPLALAFAIGACGSDANPDAAPDPVGPGSGEAGAGAETGSNPTPDGGGSDATTKPDGSSPIAVTSLSTGGNQSCAITSAGVKCWGFDGTSQLVDAKLTMRTISGIGTIAAPLSMGEKHVCARLTDGTVKCWGPNTNGILGAVAPATTTTPVAIAGLTDVISLTSGALHVCALHAGGTVSCWGSNYSHQLGNGTNVPDKSSVPLPVAGVSGATAIAAGGSGGQLTCALLAGGTVTCWGSRYYKSTQNIPAEQFPPTVVPDLDGVTALAVGRGFSCAVVAGGAVKCWGHGYHAELGTPALEVTATPVVVPGVSGATAIASGENHLCAILAGGAVTCWGSNVAGELGHGQATGPAVAGPVVGLAGVLGLGLGQLHSCALLSGGTVKCWGVNQTKQLGATSKDSCYPTNSSTPYPCSFLPIPVVFP